MRFTVDCRVPSRRRFISLRGRVDQESHAIAFAVRLGRDWQHENTCTTIEDLHSVFHRRSVESVSEYDV